jgi:HD-like signal output (HDOD) protein
MSMSPAINEQEIRYQISRIKDLPPLPQSLGRLLEIIQDEIESSVELESIICYDQALAAKVLRIANSTYYGFRRKVKTISRAIVILGFNQARTICLCNLLMNTVSNGRPIDPIMRETLWKHAFATSRIAGEIAKRRPWIKSDEALVLGLVHDIGHLVMATYFSEQFESIMKTASKRKSPPWCFEMQVGLSHTEIGKCLASRWALPESMQAVIEFHHTPNRSESYKSEVKLIYLADVLSNSRHYPLLLTDEATLSCCRELYISEDEWEDYQNSLDYIWSEVDQLWDLLR